MLTWDNLLDQWANLEQDLHEVFHFDVGDPVLMRDRSWRWLCVRINGVLNRPATYFVAGDSVQTVWTTRTQQALFQEPAASRASA